MTTLEKPVRRRVAVPHRTRVQDLYTVEVSRAGVSVRPFGARTWLGPVPWPVLVQRAAQITADARRASRRTRRSA